MDDFVNTDDDNGNWMRLWKTYTKSTKNANVYFIPYPSNGNRDFGQKNILLYRVVKAGIMLKKRVIVYKRRRITKY